MSFMKAYLIDTWAVLVLRNHIRNSNPIKDITNQTHELLDFRSGELGLQDGDRQVWCGLPEVRQVQTQRSDPEASGRHVGRTGRKKGEL